MVILTPGGELKVDGNNLGKLKEGKRVVAKESNGVGVKEQSPCHKVLLRKRLDARAYRKSLLKPQTRKFQETDIQEKLNGHDETSQGDSDHMGACSSKIAVDAAGSIVRNEEAGETDAGEGSEEHAERASSFVRELEGGTSGDTGDIENSPSSRKPKLHSDGNILMKISFGSTLEGNEACGDRFADKAYSVAPSKRMRSEELVSDAYAMAKNKKIYSSADPVSSSLSKSQRESFLEHYEACSERRFEADPQKRCTFSFNNEKNYRSCNLSPEESTSAYIDGDVSLMDKSARFVACERKSNSSNVVEYWVPVHLSNVQLEQYCATLLSNSNLLCSYSKNDLVGALQDILVSVKKSCDHPYLADQSLQRLLIKDLPVVEYLNVGVNASGKLQLLEKTLQEIKRRGLRVLVLFESVFGSPQYNIGDILDDFLRQKFGPDSYERVDSGLVPLKKQEALSMFNNRKSGRFVLLIENRACSPTIKLSSVDMAIIFNSTWNPLCDLKALQKISIEFQIEQFRVFRFYSPFTVEEKVLSFAKEDMILERHVQNISRKTSHALLLWGAHFLFYNLDEFHNGCILSSGSNISSQQSFLNDVVQEILSQLPNNSKTDETRSCKIISKAHRNGASYSNDIQLLGEKEMQSRDEELPHVLWTKILVGRYPRWRYAPVASQRTRRRVPCESQENLEKNDEVVKKRKKASKNIVYSDIPKSGVDSNKKSISRDKGGPSGTPTCNASQQNSVNHVVSDHIEMLMEESNERRNLCDSQRKSHISLKTGISKLHEIGQLPVTSDEHIQSSASVSVSKGSEASGDEWWSLSKVETHMPQPTDDLLSNPVNDGSQTLVAQLQLHSSADPLAPEQNQPDIPVFTRGDKEQINEPLPQFQATRWHPAQDQDLANGQSGDQLSTATCQQTQVPFSSSDPPLSTEKIRPEAPVRTSTQLLENKFNHAASQQIVVPSHSADCASNEPSQHGVHASTYTSRVQMNERPTNLQQVDAHIRPAFEQNKLFTYSEHIPSNPFRDTAAQPSEVRGRDQANGQSGDQLSSATCQQIQVPLSSSDPPLSTEKNRPEAPVRTPTQLLENKFNHAASQQILVPPHSADCASTEPSQHGVHASTSTARVQMNERPTYLQQVGAHIRPAFEQNKPFTYSEHIPCNPSRDTAAQPSQVRAGALAVGQTRVTVPSSDPPLSTEQIRPEAPVRTSTMLLENKFNHAASQQILAPPHSADCASTEPSQHGVHASTYTAHVQMNERLTYLQQVDAHIRPAFEQNQRLTYSEHILCNPSRDTAAQPSQVRAGALAVGQTQLLNHSVSQTNSLSRAHLPIGSFEYGSGSHLSRSRSMNFNQEFSPQPPVIPPVSSRSSQQLCLDRDPLQNESERLIREQLQTITMLEAEKKRLDSECEKEVEEIRSKYNAKLQETEMRFLQRKKTLETKYNVVYMNEMLAEAFRLKWDGQF